MIKKYVKFTLEEDEVIKLHYPLGGSIACLLLLKDRMLSSITKRAGILGIKFEGKIDNGDSPLKRAINCGRIKKRNRVWGW